MGCHATAIWAQRQSRSVDGVQTGEYPWAADGEQPGPSLEPLMPGPAPLLAALILACNPALSSKTAARYAEVSAAQAKAVGVRSDTFVALVCSESGWRSGAVSKDREDWGLGQVRARFMPGCRRDADPTASPSPSCRSEQQRLLEPGHNIEITAKAIKSWRDLCREQTGHAKERNWLAGYVGLGQQGRSLCGQSRRRGKWTELPISGNVQRILDIRKRLARQSAKGRKKSR
jgi:hypothetical protein